MAQQPTGPGSELVRYDVDAHLPAPVAGANLVPLAEVGGIVTADTYWERTGADPVRVYDDAFLGNLSYLASDRSGYRDSLEESAPGTGFSVVVTQTPHGPTWVYVRPEEEGLLVQSLAYDVPSGTIGWREGYENDTRVLVAQDRGGMYDAASTSGSTLREVLAGPESAGDELALIDEERQWRRQPLGTPGIRTGIIRTVDPAAGRVKYYALGIELQGEADKWVVTGGVVEIEPMALVGQTPAAEVGPHAETPAIAAE